MLSTTNSEEHRPDAQARTPSQVTGALCCQGQMAASVTESLSLPMCKVGLTTTFPFLTSKKGFTGSTPSSQCPDPRIPEMDGNTPESTNTNAAAAH